MYMVLMELVIINQEKKYEVNLTKNNKKFSLGYYDNLEDAIAARKEAEEKYFGEYSYDNSVGNYEEN